MVASAWIYLVGAPHPTNVIGLDEDGGIPVGNELLIGPSSECDVRVVTPLIGGRRNSRVTVSATERRWRYLHLGHSISCFHNESTLTGGERDPPGWLTSGDVFGPLVASPYDADRLTFLFVEPGSGMLRAQALPPIGEAIRAAFPVDAASRIADVRRWFVSEPLVSETDLARVLHCALCTRFLRRDSVVEVEAQRGHFQVIADSQERIGESVEYPVMGFCESCLADPAATFERAANADRFRTDLRRAIDAAQLAESPAAEELERRRAAAQPVLAGARCVLCVRDASCLAGRAKRPVCADCVRRASAVRHIRG